MKASYYGHVRKDIELLLPPSAKRILDVGAGVGATSRWLKARYPGAFTVALEGDAGQLEELRQNVDEPHIVDLNGELPGVGAPDLILFLDVLEHLLNPLDVLIGLTQTMPPHGTVIVSLPNIAHLSVSVPLFFKGRFEYKDAGILDRTHVRFFTRSSAVQLLNSAKLTVTKGLRAGFGGPRASMLERLTSGTIRDHLTKQYVMAACRASPHAVQPPINWGKV
jgi:2-polyprenyl-3-methyl-5-hydroxy-6-metoxy-1,4-benzoquinol methylase